MHSLPLEHESEVQTNARNSGVTLFSACVMWKKCWLQVQNTKWSIQITDRLAVDVSHNSVHAQFCCHNNMHKWQKNAHHIYSHHHHKHQGLDPLICSISRVTIVLANVSLVFQLFFLVVCSDMISKGFGLVAFFASVKASSVRVRSRLFCGHKGCSLLEVSITSYRPLQFSTYIVHTIFFNHWKVTGDWDRLV